MSDNKQLEMAKDLLYRGFNCVPVKETGANEYAALVDWKEYVEHRPGTELLEKWWGEWPDAHVGIVTGRISGVAVLTTESHRSPLRFQTAPHTVRHVK